MYISNRLSRFVSLFTTVALVVASLPGAGPVLADPPNPKPVLIDVEDVFNEDNYTYTILGRVTNLDEKSGVLVEVTGQPFDVYDFTNSAGEFQISIHTEFSFKDAVVNVTATSAEGEVSDPIRLVLD